MGKFILASFDLNFELIK
jgi:hypothetical protein